VAEQIERRYDGAAYCHDEKKSFDVLRGFERGDTVIENEREVFSDIDEAHFAVRVFTSSLDFTSRESDEMMIHDFSVIR
jgi:hypothetical protein